MRILDVRNPKRTKTGINLEVSFEGIDGYIEYHATEGDPEIHGKALYSNANSGLYGTPIPYIESNQEKLFKVKEDAQNKITNTDKTLLRCIKNDVPFPKEWKDYYKNLLAIVRMSSWVEGTVVPSQPPYPEGT